MPWWCRAGIRCWERDASLETMGRLTDFIRVAEGWEEGVARALEQFAGAMVVPGRDQMLHALKKAKADKLGKAVILTAVPDSASESSHVAAGRPTVARTADAGRSVTPLASLVEPNPDAADPARAGDVADTVRVLLADVAAVDDVAQAQRATSGATGFTRAVTRDGEGRCGAGAAGDLRRDRIHPRGDTRRRGGGRRRGRDRRLIALAERPVAGFPQGQGTA